MYLEPTPLRPAPTPHWSVSGPLFLLLATVVHAQNPVNRDPRSAEEKQATRMIRFLELPNRRSEAVTNLLRLGKHAVGPLTRGLDDPRYEIVEMCLQMLRVLGPVAKSAVPRLDQMVAGSDKKRAYAAAWARSRLKPEGVILIADYTKGVIREFDTKGKECYSSEVMKSLWDAERLPNGNFLATLYTNKKIVELNRKGKVVWSYTKCKSPLDADRLANGNTLIADTGANRVIEVNRAGKIVWEAKVKANAYDADRLPNGNTLITDFAGNRVIEVNMAGKIMWTVRASQPFGADRLPNGNTLITNYGGREITEVDRAGKVVHRLKTQTAPNEARRLPNGHTLVSESNTVRVYDRNGKEVRSIRTGRAGTVHYY